MLVLVHDTRFSVLGGSGPHLHLNKDCSRDHVIPSVFELHTTMLRHRYTNPLREFEFHRITILDKCEKDLKLIYILHGES